MDQEKMHTFAVKWLMKLYEPNAFPTFARDFQFEEDCEALGFLQDGGVLFREAYPEYSECWDTADFVKYVDDAELLGSGIYSKWYGLDHWAETFESGPYRSIADAFERGLEHLARLTRNTKPIAGIAGHPVESMELEIRQKIGHGVHASQTIIASIDGICQIFMDKYGFEKYWDDLSEEEKHKDCYRTLFTGDPALIAKCIQRLLPVAVRAQKEEKEREKNMCFFCYNSLEEIKAVDWFLFLRDVQGGVIKGSGFYTDDCKEIRDVAAILRNVWPQFYWLDMPPEAQGLE